MILQLGPNFQNPPPQELGCTKTNFLCFVKPVQESLLLGQITMARFTPQRSRSPPNDRKRRNSGSPEPRPKKRVPAAINLILNSDDDDAIEVGGVKSLLTMPASAPLTKGQGQYMSHLTSNC